jgi:hypothetical protein
MGTTGQSYGPTGHLSLRGGGGCKRYWPPGYQNHFPKKKCCTVSIESPKQTHLTSMPISFYNIIFYESNLLFRNHMKLLIFSETFNTFYDDSNYIYFYIINVYIFSCTLSQSL